jgi:hypothetical protein
MTRKAPLWERRVHVGAPRSEDRRPALHHVPATQSTYPVSAQLPTAFCSTARMVH